MNPRITSIENLIATDPGGRNIFGLVIADQLRLAAQSLRLARRVGIVSGFYIPEAAAGETDGPPGAKIVGEALSRIGIDVDYLTDRWNAPLFHALGVKPIIDAEDYLDRARPTHLIAIERPGRGVDGRFRNMRGVDISATTAPLDKLFMTAGRRGLTTIGIGDGGNEIGMGNVFADTLSHLEHGRDIATIVSTDFCIVAGVANWGAYGLSAALSVLAGRDLLPSPEEAAEHITRIVGEGGAVDGRTHRREPTVDGLDMAASLRMLESLRRHIAPSPLESRRPIVVGVLGFGETGRAASALLARHGHQVRISDVKGVTLEPGMVAAGVESGGHSLDFLRPCDLIVASPGVPADSPILNDLHRAGIPVVSEMELAYQLCDRRLIAVTGTVGKRSTIELMQRLFRTGGQVLPIGGNRGRPLSALLLDDDASDPLAVAVSSFQLETVVHFRPQVAVILNVREAHLDRHRTIAEYVRIKSRVFMNQGHTTDIPRRASDRQSITASSGPHPVHDVLILPFDDPRLRSLARKHHGQTFFVSAKQAVDRGAWLEGDRPWINVDGHPESIDPPHRPSGQTAAQFPENLLAALLTARLYGVDTDTLATALSDPLHPGADR